MVYMMEIRVDGGCRGDGKLGALGAAAAVFRLQGGRTKEFWCKLPYYPRPTNQRAELTAIIIAFQDALNRYESLKSYPYIEVTIRSDSKYAVNCMTEWRHRWENNGWVNSRGQGVVNRVLIQQAFDLNDRLARRVM